MQLALVSVAVLLVNIPFGAWRESVKKFSFKWFLAVHLPVPLVILLRIYGEIGFAFYTYIFLVTAFFGGQKLGGFIYSKREAIFSKFDQSK